MTKLQLNLSKITPDLLDINHKSPKVSKMLAVLNDAGLLSGGDRVALDLGCSGGFFCRGLSPFFETVIGVDIDLEAIRFAENAATENNIKFIPIDGETVPLASSSVDVIICNHVYEHVPDSDKLFVEISRLLKPDGVCYLGAASRLVIIEPHFKLPFLSWIPKWLAHRYMRVCGRGEHYYERLRTYWGIKKMIRNFNSVDYTLKIIRHPDAFSAQDMIRPGSFVTKIPVFVMNVIYPFLPSYIFILRKKI